MAMRNVRDGGSWRLAARDHRLGELLECWRRPARVSGGQVIALVHGIEGTWDSWGPLADALPGDCEVFSLALPWRAGSRYAWPHGGSSSTWLARALDLLPVPPDMVVAHSFGASTLLDLLAREVTTIGAAVLVAPLFRPYDQVVSPDFFAEVIARFRWVLRDGMRAQLGRRAAALGPDVLELMADRVRDRAEPAGLLQLFTLLSRLPAVPLATVTVPVLVVNDPGDPSAPPAAARELAARLPMARLVQRPGWGHFCQVDQPLEVAALVTGFLRDLGARYRPTFLSDPSPARATLAVGGTTGGRTP